MSVVINDVLRTQANIAATIGLQDTDAALVEAVRRCDPEAFNQLMTKYGPRVFRIAIRITRNHEDAEEVSQDSFARAFLHIGTFRGDSSFYSWLVRIVINQSLMKLRTHRRRELLFDYPSDSEGTPSWADVADDAPTPEQRYAREEVQQILASAIDELPLSARKVLHLRDVEEHSTEETARLLGLSITAVKSRTRRGRHRLRQALTKHFGKAGSSISQARIKSRGSLGLRVN
jgi:RNA polymerase sigma-70 factor (ECF subfamily)